MNIRILIEFEKTTYNIKNKNMSKEYDDFMEEYRKKHEVCPKCGSDKFITTLVGYVLYMNKKEEYKDLNECECVKCGHDCTYHERISKEEFNKK